MASDKDLEAIRNELALIRDQTSRTLSMLMLIVDQGSEADPEASEMELLGETLERKHGELAQRVKASRRGH